MKIVSLFGLVFAALAGTASAQTPAETFGTIAETWDAEISPGGKNLALGCSPNGVPAICIYALDSEAKPRLIPPPEGARVTGLYWANDDYLLYSVNTFEVLTTSAGLRDASINRLMSYSLGTGKSALLMRNARAVTNTTNVESLLVDNPKKIQMALLFDFTEDGVESTGSRLNKGGTAKNYFSYSVDLKSGKATVRESASSGGSIFDQNGKKHATIVRDYSKDYFAIKSHTGDKKIVFEDKNAALAPFVVEGLSDDRSKLIVDFDKGARDGLYTLALTDGAIEPYTVNGVEVGDVGLVHDRHRATIVGYFGADHTNQVEYTDPELKKHQQFVRDALNIENIWLTSWTADRSDLIVSAEQQGRPEQFYIYNPATPSLSPLGGEAPWLDKATLGKVTPLTYAARDGKEIPGYLTLPPGKTKEDGPFPLVLLPHGGPESRDTYDYYWLGQAVASQGYAVLQPNFRGSAGYGARFRNAGFGEFGGKMVTDVLDGAEHLVSEGIAKPGGHCTLGWSYGGYSALMTALLDSAKTKCVISVNGVTDPFALINKGSATLAYWERYMGDLYNTTSDQKRAITPIDRAGEFTQPVLLIHGEQDTTVKFSQSSRLAGKSNQVKLVTMPGDDHGMYNSASRRKVVEEALSFLAQHHPVK